VNALRDIDRGLAWVGWILAAIAVLALLIGPKVLAHDKAGAFAGAAVYGSGPGVSGPTVFKQNCGSCHTLKAAGTTGQAGPDLDNTTLSVSDIEAQIRNGGGSMPAFSGRLSDAQIKAVAAYIDATR
jgi:mono/diheme cytochrome c family protein